MEPLELQIAEQRSADFAKGQRSPMPHLRDSAVSAFRHAFLLRPPLLTALSEALPSFLLAAMTTSTTTTSSTDEVLARAQLACASFTNQELGSQPSVLTFVMHASASSPQQQQPPNTSSPSLSSSSSRANSLSSDASASQVAALVLAVLRDVDEVPDAETAPLVIGQGYAAKHAGVALGYNPPPSNTATRSDIGNGARGFLRRSFLIPLTLVATKGRKIDGRSSAAIAHTAAAAAGDGGGLLGKGVRSGLCVEEEVDEEDSNDLLMAGFRNDSKSTKRRKSFFQRRRGPWV